MKRTTASTTLLAAGLLAATLAGTGTASAAEVQGASSGVTRITTHEQLLAGIAQAVRTETAISCSAPTGFGIHPMGGRPVTGG
ncbi:hypothetical protein GXW82_07760 [Streptacidiphilus sp. 4-A2]|nr:hypothetical protein [Streptacidiphilus sp. 4-A2]